MMLRHVLRRVFPFGVLLYLLYVQYAYCYVVCKQNIYDSGWHAAGVGLIVGEAVLVVLLLASWALMFVAGPGSLPVAVPPYNLNSYYANGQLYVRGELDEKSPSVVDDAALIAPPQIFLCNADDQHRLSAAQQGPAVQIHAWLTPVKTEKHSIPSQNYQRRGPHRAPQLPAVRQRRASGRTQRPRRAAGAGNSPSL
ncbi:hypothetical protein KL935_004414 [Ogataea polymorpha]|nr:hypothetical protein KL935_004414 [Ogataea polymorpha]